MRALMSIVAASMFVYMVPAYAQQSNACPCDFSSQAFGRLLGDFSEGSVKCTLQSGLKVMSGTGGANAQKEVINTLSARALVLNKSSYTPRVWMIEYSSGSGGAVTQFSVGSFCADAMAAAMNTKERKSITTFAQYKACLNDFIAALKTIKVDCNQVDANLPDPPKGATPASGPTSLQDILNAVPLNTKPPGSQFPQPVPRNQ